MKKILTQKELKTYFKYSKSTGLFTRTVDSGKAKKGNIESSKDGYGYISICIKGKQYKAHRLAFLYVTGKCPVQVDHIKHRRTDNRWHMIREADHTVNGKNRPMQTNNKSGFVGVHWDKDRNKWQAQIKINGRSTSLGRFSNKKDAIKARKMANTENGFHKNHGAKH